MVRLLRAYGRRLLPLLIAVVVFEACQAVLMLSLPRLTADIIDRGVLARDRDRIWFDGALMLGISVAQLLCLIGGVYYGARTAMTLGRHLRRDLFHHVTAFSAREMNLFGPPTLITRITNDVQQIQTIMIMLATMVVAAPIMAGVGIFMAVRQDVALSWVLIAAVPLLGVPLGIVLARAMPVFNAMQNQADDVNQILREQITGLRVVRAFVREEVERERFGAANDALMATSIAQGRFQAVIFPLALFLQSAASIAVVWFGAGRIESGATSIGALFSFLGYIMQVLAAIMMGTMAATMVPRGAVSARRIIEVLDTEPSVATPAVPVRDVPLTGRVELRGVEFRYPGADQAVIADVSLVVTSGQTTAIVGSTGAGKTTLLNLLPRLVDVTAGAVLVDGVDVRDFDLDALWARIGVVPQRPFLFSGTIADNLRHGKADATDEEIWHALEVAQAADFVATMPAGLATPISQGGTNVSGGQRQRLSIARALIGRPSIYLFDDSFSALDLATEARLRAALGEYTAEAAVLLVAQRVSTVVDADQILVLEEGRAVGLGRHEELVGSCPTYAEIVESQASVGVFA